MLTGGDTSRPEKRNVCRGQTVRAPVVGTAGWALPGPLRPQFAQTGSLLERYSSVFCAVEINSSFRRSHRRATYERWAQAVPDGFEFAVKAPHQVTHEARLVDAGGPLTHFVDEISGLGDRLGPVLFQLPPTLTFERDVAHRFFGAWRDLFDGLTVCEPRHPSWFSPDATRCLKGAQVARVAADPPVVEYTLAPTTGPCVYFRLHGSPAVYESAYGHGRLDPLRRRLMNMCGDTPVWCIFDNTKFGAATEDALYLMNRIAKDA